jgi:hypothetical protein
MNSPQCDAEHSVLSAAFASTGMFAAMKTLQSYCAATRYSLQPQWSPQRFSPKRTAQAFNIRHPSLRAHLRQTPADNTQHRTRPRLAAPTSPRRNSEILDD